MLTKRKECEARPFPTGNTIEIAVVRYAYRSRSGEISVITWHVIKCHFEVSIFEAQIITTPLRFAGSQRLPAPRAQLPTH